jgi:alpha-N-arabinofuranosidase
MRADAYADLARQYATYCRDHGDNRLYRIAAGANEDDYAWTEALMKSYGCIGCGGNVGPFQAVSLHFYTMTGSWDAKGHATRFGTDEFYLAMLRARRIDELLRRHSAVMDVHDPGRKVGLVLDEWGTWWDVEEGTNPGFLHQQNTMRDALVASLHFDAFHAHAERLVMANIAQTVNVLQAMVLTDEETGALVLTPTFHVFEMSVGHHDATALRVHVDDGDAVRVVDDKELRLLSASASTKNGRALVSLSHLDVDEGRTVVLDLRGRDVAGHAARLLTAPSPQAHNTAASPEAVAPRPHDGVRPHPSGLEVDLPPHSFVTVELDLAAR